MAIDLLSAFSNEPPELDFIWPGFLAQTVGALVAPGATGKSFYALEAAMSISCAVAGGDLVGLNPKKNGLVCYFAGEDPETAIIRRAHSIGKHLSPEARQGIAKNLFIEAIMGRRLDIMNKEHQDYILRYCEGSRLIVFDTLSRIHQLDENSNGQMAHLIAELEWLARQTGAAVLFLHHISKGSAREGAGDQQQAARGASALIDNARWCGFVSGMTESEAERLTDESFSKRPIGQERRRYFVRYGVSKQNYSEPLADRWFERKDGGVLIPVHLNDAKKEIARDGSNGKKKDRNEDGL